MADHFVETERTGFFGNVGRSFAMIPIGALLFLGSFVLIWLTAGRTDYSKIVTEAVDASAEAPGQDGAFVAVTGPLGATAKVGDPEYLAPGDWLRLERVAEMYAWAEQKETKTRKKVGGGEVKETTYDYVKEWTTSPDDSASFKYPADHQNPVMTITGAAFAAERGKVGAWTFDPREAEDLPAARELPLQGLSLLGAASSARQSGSALYFGKGTLEAPQVGDQRVSFRAVPLGGRVTAFAKAAGSELVPYVHDGEDKVLHVLEGTREEATLALKQRFKTMGMIGYIGGFVLMWIGMTMMLGPIPAILDVLPFMGSGARGLIGCVTFPIAAAISFVTIVVAVVVHSPILLALLVVGIGVGGWFFIKKRKEAAAAAE